MQSIPTITTVFIEGPEGAGRQATILGNARRILGSATPSPDLEAELLQLPALIADLGVLAASCNYQKTCAKQDADTLYAQVSDQVRENLSATGGRITDSVVKTMADKDPGVCAAERKVAFLDRERQQLLALLSGIEARKAALLVIARPVSGHE